MNPLPEPHKNVCKKHSGKSVKTEQIEKKKRTREGEETQNVSHHDDDGID